MTFLQKQKKLIILAVAVGLLLFCTIGIPLICVNHYCFKINFDEGTSTIRVQYTGTNDEIYLLVNCYSVGELKYRHDFIPEDKSAIKLKHNDIYFIPITVSDDFEYYELTIQLNNGKVPAKTLYNAYYVEDELHERWQGDLPRLKRYSDLRN